MIQVNSAKWTMLVALEMDIGLAIGNYWARVTLSLPTTKSTQRLPIFSGFRRSGG